MNPSRCPAIEKSPIISASFAERDLQLTASWASWLIHHLRTKCSIVNSIAHIAQMPTYLNNIAHIAQMKTCFVLWSDVMFCAMLAQCCCIVWCNIFAHAVLYSQQHCAHCANANMFFFFVIWCDVLRNVGAMLFRAMLICWLGTSHYVIWCDATCCWLCAYCDVMWCAMLQVSFRKRATNYRALFYVHTAMWCDAQCCGL